jgi:hypothetical protein
MHKGSVPFNDVPRLAIVLRAQIVKASAQPKDQYLCPNQFKHGPHHHHLCGHAVFKGKNSLGPFFGTKFSRTAPFGISPPTQHHLSFLHFTKSLLSENHKMPREKTVLSKKPKAAGAKKAPASAAKGGKRKREEKEHEAAAGGAKRKPHHYRPGTRAVMNVRKEQQKSAKGKEILPRQTLVRLVRLKTEDLAPGKGLRFQSSALNTLHMATGAASHDVLKTSTGAMVAWTKRQGLLASDIVQGNSIVRYGKLDFDKLPVVSTAPAPRHTDGAKKAKSASAAKSSTGKTRSGAGGGKKGKKDAATAAEPAAAEAEAVTSEATTPAAEPDSAVAETPTL